MDILNKLYIMGNCIFRNKVQPVDDRRNIKDKEIGDIVHIKVEKYKKKAIPPKLKEDVWRRDFNNIMDGVCYCCGSKITFREHECGHIIAERMGGKTNINNLRAVCRSCNRSMGVQNMEEYKIAHY
mgnify:CR=1 FL=1